MGLGMFPLRRRCDGCGQDDIPATKTPQGNIILDNGISLPFWDCGYYSGFSDGPGPDVDEGLLSHWALCHDCVVRMLEVLPRLSSRLSPGMHPYAGAQPCCKWAYSVDYDVEPPATMLPGLDAHGDLVWVRLVEEY